MAANTGDVRRLYESFPYPYGVGRARPDFLFVYLLRGYFHADPLAGWRILDAGCGTGHKLVALALSFPKASFLGIDLSERSVSIARDLVAEHGLRNVEVRQGNILELDAEGEFDFVQSFGVVHHLEDPQRGLGTLRRALKDDGILSIWLYHPFGEAERLQRREELQILWGRAWDDLPLGVSLLRELGTRLAPDHYGPGRVANELEADADAFLHPIVRAYRFGEALAMLRVAGLDWAAIDFLNLEGAVKLVNLSGIDEPGWKEHCVQAPDLYASALLRERCSALSSLDQLALIELAIRPRGFQVLSGRGESYRKVEARVRGNVVPLAAAGA